MQRKLNSAILRRTDQTRAGQMDDQERAHFEQSLRYEVNDLREQIDQMADMLGSQSKERCRPSPVQHDAQNGQLGSILPLLHHQVHNHSLNYNPQRSIVSLGGLMDLVMTSPFESLSTLQTLLPVFQLKIEFRLALQ